MLSMRKCLFRVTKMFGFEFNAWYFVSSHWVVYEREYCNVKCRNDEWFQCFITLGNAFLPSHIFVCCYCFIRRENFISRLFSFAFERKKLGCKKVCLSPFPDTWHCQQKKREREKAITHMCVCRSTLFTHPADFKIPFSCVTNTLLLRISAAITRGSCEHSKKKKNAKHLRELAQILSYG